MSDCCEQWDVLQRATQFCRTDVGSVMCYSALRNCVGLLWAVLCVTVRYGIVSDCCGQWDVLQRATQLCRTAVGSVMCYSALQNCVVLLWAL